MRGESTEAMAPDIPASGASSRFRPEHAMSTIWLVFLAIPITLAWTLDRAGFAWQLTATLATIAFGVTYSLYMYRYLAQFTMKRLPFRTVVRGTLLLLPYLLLAMPALGGGVVSFLPFLTAIGAFSLPLRQGLGWSTGMLAATIAVTALLEGPDWISFVIGPAIGVAFVTVMRVIDDLGESERRAKEERAWVHEREAISRDIHDVLGHSLTVVSLKAQLARRLLRTDPARAEHELDEVLALTQRALDDARSTVGRLRTPDLAAQYVAVAAALADADIAVEREGDWRAWDPERRALAAWALREATTNVLRHSQARTCRIRFLPDALVIADDGIGLDGSEEGHGLTGLRRRVADGGGALFIGDRTGGTELRVDFA